MLLGRKEYIFPKIQRICMVDQSLVMLSDILGLSAKELLYPQVVLTVILPVVANLICFYSLHRELRVFGRGTLNDFISIGLAVIFSFFAVRLGFVGYGLASIGISFVYFKNDVTRLLVVIFLLGFYTGVSFLI